jgi:hypothetical protein
MYISTVAARQFNFPTFEDDCPVFCHTSTLNVGDVSPEMLVNSKQTTPHQIQKPVMVASTALRTWDFLNKLYVQYSEQHKYFHGSPSVGEPIVGNHFLSHSFSEDDGQIYCGGISIFIGLPQ